MTEAFPDRTPLLVELSLRVKTYDIDFVGHVNNIVYIRWLEDLRLELLDVHCPLDTLLSQGIAPIIVTTHIHYRQAISLLDHQVHASMWITELGQATIHLAAQFTVGNEVKCTATQRGTFIDTAKMRPIRIPQQLRDRFEQSLAAGNHAR